jgi:HK97 family phage prohead protease
MTARPMPKPGERLYKAGQFVRAVEENGKRRMRFVASDESVDRYGDIIRAAGWQLENFRKNPVLLFGHNSREPAIGGVPAIGVEGTQLMADVEFDTNPDNVTANVVWGLLQQGYMRAVSVGFVPTGKINSLVDDHGNWTGYEFTSQELLELSVVPVPANPQALAVAKSHGLDAAAARRLFAAGPLADARAAHEQRRHIHRHLELRGTSP